MGEVYSHNRNSNHVSSTSGSGNGGNANANDANNVNGSGGGGTNDRPSHDVNRDLNNFQHTGGGQDVPGGHRGSGDPGGGRNVSSGGPPTLPPVTLSGGGHHDIRMSHVGVSLDQHHRHPDTVTNQQANIHLQAPVYRHIPNVPSMGMGPYGAGTGASSKPSNPGSLGRRPNQVQGQQQGGSSGSQQQGQGASHHHSQQNTGHVSAPTLHPQHPQHPQHLPIHSQASNRRPQLMPTTPNRRPRLNQSGVSSSGSVIPGGQAGSGMLSLGPGQASMMGAHCHLSGAGGGIPASSLAAAGGLHTRHAGIMPGNAAGGMSLGVGGPDLLRSASGMVGATPRVDHRQKEPAYHPQVEAISPAPEEAAMNDDLSKEKDEIGKRLCGLEQEIQNKESQLRKMIERKDQLTSRVRHPSGSGRIGSGTGTAGNELGERNFANLIQAIITDNRRKAQEQHQTMSRLCGPTVDPCPLTLPLYRQPSDLPVLIDLQTKFHGKFKPLLIRYIQRRKMAEKKRIELLAQQYDTYAKIWCKKLDKLNNSIKRRQKEARMRECFEKMFPEIRKNREDRERLFELQGKQPSGGSYDSATAGGCSGNDANAMTLMAPTSGALTGTTTAPSDASTGAPLATSSVSSGQGSGGSASIGAGGSSGDFGAGQQQLDEDALLADPAEELRKIKEYSIEPPLMVAPWNRKYKFINSTGLTKDAKADHRTAQDYNSRWTKEEGDLFREKFIQFPKNFLVIASYLEKKSTSECVQYYYLTKKQENYKQLVKKHNARRRRAQVERQQQRIQSEMESAQQNADGQQGSGDLEPESSAFMGRRRGEIAVSTSSAPLVPQQTSGEQQGEVVSSGDTGNISIKKEELLHFKDESDSGAGCSGSAFIRIRQLTVSPQTSGDNKKTSDRSSSDFISDSGIKREDQDTVHGLADQGASGGMEDEPKTKMRRVDGDHTRPGSTGGDRGTPRGAEGWSGKMETPGGAEEGGSKQQGMSNSLIGSTYKELIALTIEKTLNRADSWCDGSETGGPNLTQQWRSPGSSGSTPQTSVGGQPSYAVSRSPRNGRSPYNDHGGSRQQSERSGSRQASLLTEPISPQPLRATPLAQQGPPPPTHMGALHNHAALQQHHQQQQAAAAAQAHHAAKQQQAQVQASLQAQHQAAAVAMAALSARQPSNTPGQLPMPLGWSRPDVPPSANVMGAVSSDSHNMLGHQRFRPGFVVGQMGQLGSGNPYGVVSSTPSALPQPSMGGSGGCGNDPAAYNKAILMGDFFTAQQMPRNGQPSHGLPTAPMGMHRGADPSQQRYAGALDPSHLPTPVHSMLPQHSSSHGMSAVEGSRRDEGGWDNRSNPVTCGPGGIPLHTMSQEEANVAKYVDNANRVYREEVEPYTFRDRSDSERTRTSSEASQLFAVVQNIRKRNPMDSSKAAHHQQGGSGMLQQGTGLHGSQGPMMVYDQYPERPPKSSSRAEMPPPSSIQKLITISSPAHSSQSTSQQSPVAANFRKRGYTDSHSSQGGPGEAAASMDTPAGGGSSAKMRAVSSPASSATPRSKEKAANLTAASIIESIIIDQISQNTEPDDATKRIEASLLKETNRISSPSSKSRSTPTSDLRASPSGYLLPPTGASASTTLSPRESPAPRESTAAATTAAAVLNMNFVNTLGDHINKVISEDYGSMGGGSASQLYKSDKFQEIDKIKASALLMNNKVLAKALIVSAAGEEEMGLSSSSSILKARSPIDSSVTNLKGRTDDAKSDSSSSSSSRREKPPGIQDFVSSRITDHLRTSTPPQDSSKTVLSSSSDLQKPTHVSQSWSREPSPPVHTSTAPALSPLSPHPAPPPPAPSSGSHVPLKKRARAPDSAPTISITAPISAPSTPDMLDSSQGKQRAARVPTPPVVSTSLTASPKVASPAMSSPGGLQIDLDTSKKEGNSDK